MHLSSLLGVIAKVEVKTKKLKKLWSKYQTAHREIKDIQEEFQQERSDMLDTIRELTRQLKLKEVGSAPSSRTLYLSCVPYPSTILLPGSTLP